MLRKGRASVSGQIYHVTTTTLDREPVFRTLHNARALITTLMTADARGDARTLAFVLMPDHLHWLFELGGERALPRVVQQMKMFSARRIGRRIWQTGFHDHALRTDEDVVRVARYIVANPLRAGLVSSPGEYPHWDAVWV